MPGPVTFADCHRAHHHRWHPQCAGLALVAILMTESKPLGESPGDDRDANRHSGPVRLADEIRGPHDCSSDVRHTFRRAVVLGLSISLPAAHPAEPDAVAR
jgi:hypothetical protein